MTPRSAPSGSGAATSVEPRGSSWRLRVEELLQQERGKKTARERESVCVCVREKSRKKERGRPDDGERASKQASFAVCA